MESLRMSSKNSGYPLIKKFLCVQTNTKVVTKENKLYSFFLHEDFYSIICSNVDSNLGNFSSLVKKNNSKQSQKASFVTIKSIIFVCRSNNFSVRKRSFFFVNDVKKKIIVSLILESIAFILLSSQEKKFFLRKTFSISIHKTLASIEQQCPTDSFGFQGHFDRLFHPEVLIRILRIKINDISFLHLLRIVLHSYAYLSTSMLKDSPFIKIRNILWNIYVLEIDLFFVADCNNSCTLGNKNYVSSNHSLSFFKKIYEWEFFLKKEEYKNFYKSKISPYNLFKIITKHHLKDEFSKQSQNDFGLQFRTYKYFRTNTNWFLFFQNKKPCNYFIKRRIVHFIIRRLGYILKKNTINSLFPYTLRESPSYFFLAYILQFTKKRNFVKINTKLFFFINFFYIRIISFINPFYLIILILSKKKFCSPLGYPKNKSGWVTWTDQDILHRFNCIQNSISLFYSGCNNNKVIYRIQYLLQFSCAKTLACKHKTNLKQIFFKFVKNQKEKEFRQELVRFVVPHQSTNSRLRYWYKNQKIIRNWNFHLIQMDSILFHLEDFFHLIKS